MVDALGVMHRARVCAYGPDSHDYEILSLAARRNQCPDRQGIQSHHPDEDGKIAEVSGTIWADNQNGSPPCPSRY